LTEDLVLAANHVANGIARRAAANLGLAETTFRRQLEKVKRVEYSGLLARTASWEVIRPVIAEIIALKSHQNIVEQAKQLLLKEVIKRTGDHYSVGAALMGVTLPTYRRWREKLPE
jgi:DNA-binding protein Fis